MRGSHQRKSLNIRGRGASLQNITGLAQGMTIIKILSCCFTASQHMGTACPGLAWRQQHATAAVPSQIAWGDTMGDERPRSSPERGHQTHPVTAFRSPTCTWVQLPQTPPGCFCLPQPRECPNHEGAKVTRSCCHRSSHRFG